MALESLTATLRRDPNLTTALAQHAAQQAILETVRAALPAPLRPAVTAVSFRAQALMLTVRAHASATKVHQYQQQILAAASAKDLNFNEIRVFVQTFSEATATRNRHAVIPPEAAESLARAERATANPKLRAALARLRARAERKNVV